MFSVTGRIVALDRPVTVQWHDGELSGDREAIGMLRAMARDLEGRSVGPISGPYTYTNHLASGLSAVTLIAGLFERVDSWVGEVPRRVAPPVNGERWIEPVWNTNRKGRNR